MEIGHREGPPGTGGALRLGLGHGRVAEGAGRARQRLGAPRWAVRAPRAGAPGAVRWLGGRAAARAVVACGARPGGGGQRHGVAVAAGGARQAAGRTGAAGLVAEGPGHAIACGQKK